MENTNNGLIAGWWSEGEAKKNTGFKTTKLWLLRQQGVIQWSRIGGKVFYKIESFLALLEKNIVK